MIGKPGVGKANNRCFHIRVTVKGKGTQSLWDSGETVHTPQNHPVEKKKYGAFIDSSLPSLAEDCSKGCAEGKLGIALERLQGQ